MTTFKNYDEGETRIRQMKKCELVEVLKVNGMSNPSGVKKKLQELCEARGLPTNIEIKKVTEGWCQKPKGALQILFERGWIDPANIHLYTEKGKGSMNSVSSKGRDKGNSSVGSVVVDPTGCCFSLRKLMKLQRDFLNEITLLQYHAKLLGVDLDRTPKCHPEIAGEGIEYVWALSKLFYRQAPLKDKRNKCEFKNLVRKSTDPSSVLRIQDI